VADEQQQAMRPPAPSYTRQISQPITDKSMIQWQLEMDEEISEVIMILKGYIKEYNADDPTKFTWKREEISEGIPKPGLINDEGIIVFEAYMRTHVSKNMALSDMSEIDANKMLLDIANNLALKIFDSAEKYGIAEENVDAVFDIIQNPIEAMIRKSINGGYQKFISASSKYVEQVSQQPVAESRGLVARILGRTGK
jgi:hypothetical protein